jgi:hypothetical protein
MAEKLQRAEARLESMLTQEQGLRREGERLHALEQGILQQQQEELAELKAIHARERRNKEDFIASLKE